MFVLPPSMKAIVVQEDRTVGYLDRPIPIIDDDEVLVKTSAVALNNSDWKGTIPGWDVSGEIVQVGKDVAARKVGERVAAFMHGGYWRDRGAFSEYVKVRGDLLWVLPEKTSFEEAATLSCGTWTVVQSLFHPTRLGLVEPEAEGDPIPRDEWVFIYAGSSYFLRDVRHQLLHVAGYKVVTTASPRNFPLLKSLGATAMFAYRDPKAVLKINAATGHSITKVLDCISTLQSQQFSQDVISPEGGNVISLVDMSGLPTVTFLVTALGKEFTSFGQTFPKMTILVEQGKLVPNPRKLWSGGLAAVPEGLNYIQEGKQSAEKIVFSM
ncbi:GroES-like protein [Ganoderma leucocontextum]|nr:GroES-like protein [Ganoderma leucocontextum]